MEDEIDDGVDVEDVSKLHYVKPTDFDKFLPWVCKEFCLESEIIVTRAVQSQYVSIAGVSAKDRAKLKAKLKSKTPTDSSSNAEVTSRSQMYSTKHEVNLENVIYIETTYDENQDLVRLKFLKCTKIPRSIFKLIALAIPYQKTLSSLIINRGLDAKGIREISSYYPKSYITEICLDNTNIPEANYHILLDNDIIKHFSLSRCNITDAVVKTIADKLTGTCPASTSLSALNLSSNRFTEVGVKYLAHMLRSNRHLSYLNLANNTITDKGAESILNTLQKFALTREEVLDRSRRLMSYLKAKDELIRKTMKELRSDDYDKKFAKKKTTKSAPVKKKPDYSESKSVTNTEGSLSERAEFIAERVLGTFHDPFSPENTENGKSVTYCLGNNTLNYLNLAFNNLTYCSIKKVCEVLQSQSRLCRNPKGLINIRIEGNYLPENCSEYKTIDDLLLPGLSMHKNVVEHVKKKTGFNVHRN